MKKFQKLNPSNSRILIDIKRRKVKFSYPNKKEAFWIIFPVLMAICSFIFIAFLIANTPTFFYFLKSIDKISNPILFSAVINIIFLNLFVIPYTLSTYLSDKKWFLEKMPRIQCNLSLLLGGGYKYIKISKLKSREFEIPFFHNVFLSYELLGDFKKHLSKIEVTEHNFYYISKNIFMRKFKKEKQDAHWKAKFIFAKIPKDGFMEIKYV